MFYVLNRSGTCRPLKCKVLLLNMNIKNALHLTHGRKSHYTSLGLDPSASSKDIKAAYYNLSLKYHPDKNQGSPESTAKFREITAAYEVLCNPDKKRQYDRGLNLYSSPLRNDYYPRSSNHYRDPPRSGRTQHYNYDEHYKQHYEEYYRQRKMEHEHFKRRWEADRRYRYGDQYTGSSNYYSEGNAQGFRMRELLSNRSFISLLTFWAFIMVFAEIADHFNPDNTKKRKQGPVYYKTKEGDLKSD